MKNVPKKKISQAEIIKAGEELEQKIYDLIKEVEDSFGGQDYVMVSIRPNRLYPHHQIMISLDYKNTIRVD